MRKSLCALTVVVCLLLAAGAARAQNEAAPRHEVGAHFSALTLTPADFYRTEAGFGGRYTLNLNDNVALEAEGTFFPNSGRSGEPRASGRAIQGLFGVKAGRRYEKFGLFAKARPGFVSFGEGKLVADPNFVSGGFFGLRSKRATHFAADVGGVLELYVSRRITTRFDFGDTIIRYGSQSGTIPGTDDIPTLVIALPDRTRHNFQFNAGIGFRFD